MSSAVRHFYRFGQFRLDTSEHLVYRQNGEVVPLKPKVVETLELLVQESGRLISKDELMQRLWPDTVVEESNLAQNIYLLRKMLGVDAAGRSYIETIPKRGYRFTSNVEEVGGGIAENRGIPASIKATATESNELASAHVAVVHGSVISKAKSAQSRWPAILAMLLSLLVVGGGIAIVVVRFVGRRERIADRVALPFQSVRLRRITDSGDVADVALSPDGRSVAYATIRNVIWIQNLATGSRLQLLPESEAERRGLRFSPDGNHLYFHQGVREKKIQKTQLTRVSVLGGQAQKVAEGDFHTALAIAPDGKRFAFIHWFMERGEMALTVLDGSSQRTVTTRKSPDYFGLWGKTVAWSPDGQHIACVEVLKQNDNNVASVVIVNVADGSAMRLPNQGRVWNFLGELSWLPKGNGLVVSAREDVSSTIQIWRVSYPEGEWRKITNDLSEYSNESVSADGSYMVTVRENESSNLWNLPQADISRARQITFGNGHTDGAAGLSWTPDGRIVFASNLRGSPQIWMADADGGNLKQLTFGSEPCSQPFVSPDGRYIVFKSYRDNKSHIWRMDSDGSNIVQLTDGPGEAWPVITSDGHDVMYTSYAPPFSTIWSVALTGGAASKELTVQFPVGQGRSSPDGKLFAASFYDAGSQSPWRIGIFPAKGGQPLTSIDRPLIGLANWTSDSQAVIYLDQQNPYIWKQSLDGGAAVRVLSLTLPEHIYNFAFSPDNSKLVIARGRPQMDALLIEDIK
jgi:Tol biopolymer transport system component/DNA-binding winged helix-turn-helix (wHTH) protein